MFRSFVLCGVCAVCCMHNTSAHLESILIDLIVAPGDLRFPKRYQVIDRFILYYRFNRSRSMNIYLTSDTH